MMFKQSFILTLILLVFSISFVSAQWVESPNFVEVSSAQVGSHEEGCFVASMSGMLASLNNPKIGSNPGPIINALNTDLCKTGGKFPYAQYDVLVSVLRYLMGAL